MTKNTITKATVKLNIELEDGFAHGTGFLYTINIRNKKRHFILTNKHVVAGGKAVHMKFATTQDGRNGLANNRFEYSSFRMKDVIYHPNAKVDLCALPVNAAFNAAARSGVKLDVASFSSENLPNKRDLEMLSAIEDIMMIGYPSYGADILGNLPPMVTKGVTATDPKINYNGSKEFVADVNGDNGSSGSPIVHINKDSMSSKGRLEFFETVMLLGIAFCGYEYTRVFTIEHENYSIPINYEIGSGLMVVIKAERISELEKLIKRRALESAAA